MNIRMLGEKQREERVLFGMALRYRALGVS